MNDFFNRLVTRAVDGAEAVRPRTPTLFEPARGLERANDAGSPQAGAPHVERCPEESTAPLFAHEANFTARLAALESILSQTRDGAVSAGAGNYEQASELLAPVPAPNLRVAITPAEPALGSTANHPERPTLPTPVPAPSAIPSTPQSNAQFAIPMFAPRKRITSRDSGHDGSEKTERLRVDGDAVPDSSRSKDAHSSQRGRSLDRQPVQPEPILRQPLPMQPLIPAAKTERPETSSHLSIVGARATSPSRVDDPHERPIPQPAQTRLPPASVVPSVQLAPPFAPPMAAATPQPIHVTIGRLEIRAVPAPAGHQRTARRPAPVVGLEDYLRGRAAGGAA